MEIRKSETQKERRKKRSDKRRNDLKNDTKEERPRGISASERRPIVTYRRSALSRGAHDAVLAVDAGWPSGAIEAPKALRTLRTLLANGPGWSWLAGVALGAVETHLASTAAGASEALGRREHFSGNVSEYGKERGSAVYGGPT